MNRDFTPIAFGVALTAILSGTFVIAGLKAGITPGVSPLVILCAWGLFSKRLSGSGGSRFLNLTQVAGSAGMAVTAGVIFTAPIVQILYRERMEAGGPGAPTAVPPVDVVTLILLSLAGALIGYGFVGLATKKFLSDPTLPAPEARACETMIKSAVAHRDQRPRMGRSLFAALAAGFGATLAVKMGALSGAFTAYTRDRGDQNFAIRLPLDAMLIGIGGLLTLSTALLVFGGAMVRMLGEAFLVGLEPGTDTYESFLGATHGDPDPTMRWAGGATMLVAVIYSLFKFMGPRSGEANETADDTSVLKVDSSMRNKLRASIAAGVVLLLGWLFMKDGITTFSISMSVTILVMAMLMVTLGAILSLQIGSSASPVSGTIFVTTLVLCLVTLATRSEVSIDDVLLLTPLIVGACVAVCTANDSSQDYKTIQLCGMRVQDGFVAQILGLIVGCIIVPIVLYVAHGAYTLGSEALPAPQGKMFSTLIEGLLLDSNLPMMPIYFGLGLGVLAVLMEILATSRGKMLPAMALAVGIYLPAAIGVGILIGALFRWLGERKSGKQTNESILTAAGLITGAALLELILGVMILGGFAEESLEMFHGAMHWTALLGIGGAVVTTPVVRLLGATPIEAVGSTVPVSLVFTVNNVLPFQPGYSVSSTGSV